MAEDIHEVLSRYPDDEPIPLIDIARVLRVTEPRQSALVRDGLVTTLPGRRGSRGGERLISQDEATRLLLAGCVAAAMGLSLYVLLKALATAGIDPAALAGVIGTAGKAGNAGAHIAAFAGVVT